MNQLLLEQTVFHRRPDAWDLLDEQRHVVAVLCPRTDYVSVSPVPERVAPARTRGGFLPYGERVKWKIRAENIGEGIELVRRLVAAE